MAWLLRDGDVLAALEERRPGWPVDLSGALVLRSPTFIQTIRPAATLDLAWCAGITFEDGRPGLVVRRIATVAAHRVATPRIRPGALVVAASGSFDRWRLRVGDRLEKRDV